MICQLIFIFNHRLKHHLEDRTSDSVWQSLQRPRHLIIDVMKAVLYFASDEGLFVIGLDGMSLKKVVLCLS